MAQIQKLGSAKVDLSTRVNAPTTPSPSMSIIIQGNVIGEEKYIKKLGDTVAANMRAYGNNATVYG